MYHLKLKRPKTLFRFFFYLAALPPLIALIFDGLFDGLSKFAMMDNIFGSLLYAIRLFGLLFWLIPPSIVFPSLFRVADCGYPVPVDWRSWVAAILLYSVVAVALWLLRGGRIVHEKIT